MFTEREMRGTLLARLFSRRQLSGTSLGAKITTDFGIFPSYSAVPNFLGEVRVRLIPWHTRLRWCVSVVLLTP